MKTSVRKTGTGEVRYFQLAHNEWDPGKGWSVPKVIYGFGREDQLDKEAVRRLVAEEVPQAMETGDHHVAEPVRSLEMGPYDLVIRAIGAR